jgi:hypothetical protein
MSNLEQEIDLPMQNLIALLNLYGLTTVWCCCGFNDREPDKDHVVGRPQVWIKTNPDSYLKIIKLLDYEIFAVTQEWQCVIRKMSFQAPMFEICCNFDKPKGAWTNANSKHYHERINVAIKHLCDRLLQFQDQFIDEVIIEDGNAKMQEQMQGWMVEPSQPWVVQKAKYVSK